MSEKVPKTKEDWHRTFAVDYFNLTWDLLDKTDRTPEEAVRMIHTAHTSRLHWEEIGTPLNLARGDWQLSRVYAVLGKPAPALKYAKLSLEICQREGYGDFDLAFAYEAMARAYAVAGDEEQRDRYLDLAREAGEKIEKDGDRKYFLGELETIS